MLTREQIAKVVHEVNKAYCESLGDLTQTSWEEAPDWQKISALNGVKFHQNKPDRGPSASHASWMLEKLRAGWKYGPVKDTEKKEHPSLVDYDELPQEERAKDFIFTAIVKTLSAI